MFFRDSLFPLVKSNIEQSLTNSILASLTELASLATTVPENRSQENGSNLNPTHFTFQTLLYDKSHKTQALMPSTVTFCSTHVCAIPELNKQQKHTLCHHWAQPSTSKSKITNMKCIYEMFKCSWEKQMKTKFLVYMTKIVQTF